MTSYLESHDESYHQFLTEAQDLLASIEQDLLSLRDHHTPAQVHSLMRAAHTLKGAAASINRDAIKQVAHVMEDIFSALYSPQAVIDDRVEGLLFQGYECLRLLLSAELKHSAVDEAEVLNRAASIIADLQEILGDCFQEEVPVLHSTDLGFDLVQSMFETGVSDRLTNLEEIMRKNDAILLLKTLQSHVDVFLGLAESLNLPGFGKIASTTSQALQINPEQVMLIAQVALKDFSMARDSVL
ncbi:MAG: Hpt domain-containing protein, partial [Leptolyngbyaceae bacterium]|nr:Hpt domain-containing protein [Leptolyngbyaceae bacterium]